MSGVWKYDDRMVTGICCVNEMSSFHKEDKSHIEIKKLNLIRSIAVSFE